MDAFSDPALRDAVSPFVQMLWERGPAYEREVVLRQQRRSVTFLLTQQRGGSDLHWFSQSISRARLETARSRSLPLRFFCANFVNHLLGGK
jgi:hypothetical protein